MEKLRATLDKINFQYDYYDFNDYFSNLASNNKILFK